MRESKVFILTGDKGDGKTTLARDVISCLQKQGFRIGGFLAMGYWQGDERSHFDLLELETENVTLFCTRKPHSQWPSHGPFYFNPEAIRIGYDRMEEAVELPPDLFVIDEIGKFELGGHLWDAGIIKLMKHRIFPQLWTARRTFIPDIINRYGPKNVAIFEAGKTGPHPVCQEISLQILSPL